MAGASLLTLIDDIATLLDDVSVMTKVAAKKTAGVLGDDLALNAQQVTGINADRELPVVWAVAKGSLINKAILVPLALLLAAWQPWLVTVLLMIGGAYLCFEGFEKIAHKWLHKPEEDAQHHAELLDAIEDETVDMVQFEKDKIKGAVRTDFVLSAEIIVITLGTVASKPLMEQLAVLVGISLIMTVGVYGFVAGIVKLDDIGLWLAQKKSTAAQQLGRFFLWLMPVLMKVLAFVGTLAMFLVGGAIVAHNLPTAFGLHHLYEIVAHSLPTWLSDISSTVMDGLSGLVVGALVLVCVTVISKLIPKKSSSAH
ncbi:MAG: hypothetical protein H6R05_1318 [Burkholderiaceae bacterium]|nr:hypothetical protein [Burkholderiaceae bacterium]